MTDPDSILQQYGLTLRAGHTEVKPAIGATANVLEAIRPANKAGRLPGLPDELNPVLIDEDKVRFFLEHLPKVRPAILSALRGARLNLSDPKLQLLTTSTADLSKGYDLDVKEASAGAIADARVLAPLDAKLSRERADRAKAAMEAANKEAAEWEKRKQQPDADSSVYVSHSTAQRKRYAAATVWRNLTSALSAASPSDSKLKQEADLARKTAASYIVAPWTGMP